VSGSCAFSEDKAELGLDKTLAGIARTIEGDRDVKADEGHGDQFFLRRKSGIVSDSSISCSFGVLAL
jgi:hypothetical protein